MMNEIDDRFLEESCGIERFAGRRKRIWLRALSGLAAVFAAVFLTINLFPTVAYAVGDVPVLRELIAALTLDQNLRLCLTHDYAQYVGQSQTDHGLTAQVQYLIADPSRVSVFVQTDAADLDVCFTDFSLYDGAGQRIPVSSIGAEGVWNDEWELRFDLGEAELPELLQIRFSLLAAADLVNVEAQWEENAVRGDFQFQIPLDLAHVAQPKTVRLDQRVELAGQRFTLDRLEIHPTQSKLYFQADPDNTAYLQGLAGYLEDEFGNRCEIKRSGAIGASVYHEDVDYWEMDELWLDSSYFFDSEEITIYFTAVKLVEKAERLGLVSYERRTVENLPHGVTLQDMVLDENGSLEIWLHTEEQGGILYDVTTRYFDAADNPHFFDETPGVMQSTAAGGDETGFLNRIVIPNFEEKNCYLEFITSSAIPLKEPVVITAVCGG